jgi:polysaccharide export outer membrane protein
MALFLLSRRLVAGASGARSARWLGALLLLATVAGGSGCNTAPVIADAIRGWRAEIPVAMATSLAEQPGSSNTPVSWNTGKEADRPALWAEARATAAPTDLANGTSAAQVVWRAQGQAPVAGPMLAPDKQDKSPKEPAQKDEQAPAPRVLPADKAPASAGSPVVLGPPVPKTPNELHKVSLPSYTVAPPDILLVESTRGLPTQPVRGQHLVRPDGTLSLGTYGSIYVAGMTLDQVAAAVARAIESRLDPKAVQENPVKLEDVSVDVLAYNSKVYYVITDGGGYGEQVYKFPVTGNDTVLDAIANITGLPAVASKKHIWVARRTPHGAPPAVLPVDWCGIAQRGDTGTNYQLFPGDRVYVQANKLITVDSWLAKVLAPVERVLGVTLLGSSTVNSIRNRGTGGTTP